MNPTGWYPVGFAHFCPLTSNEDTMNLTLDPIDYPDDDPYRDPAVHRACERFWWHQAIVDELRRVRDECTNPETGAGYPAFNIPGLAGNIRGANVVDTIRHCRQMITWGELVKADPLWDFAPDLWVSLREPHVTP